MGSLRGHVYSDEDLFQFARRLVIALLQKITLEDWLPSLLGDELGAILNSHGRRPKYSPHVDASILNEFATAAMRVGLRFSLFHAFVRPS